MDMSLSGVWENAILMKAYLPQMAPFLSDRH